MNFKNDSQRKAVMSQYKSSPKPLNITPSQYQIKKSKGWSDEDIYTFERLDQIEKEQKQVKSSKEFETLEKERCKLVGIPYYSPVRRSFRETSRRIIP